MTGTDRATLAAIIESSDDAIVTKALDGIIKSWNPAAERLFGYRAEEVIRRPITILFPPGRLSEEAEFQRRLAAGQRVEHFDGFQGHLAKPVDPADLVTAMAAVVAASGVSLRGGAAQARE